MLTNAALAGTSRRVRNSKTGATAGGIWEALSGCPSPAIRCLRPVIALIARGAHVK